MPMKWTLAVFGMVVSVVLAGCSAKGAPPQPLAASSTPTSTSTPTVSPESSPSNPLPLGATFTETDPGLAADVTVFAVNQNIVPDAPAPPSGGHWAGADVQVCLKEARTDYSVGWSDWSVADPANGQYQASTDKLVEFPIPQFPFAPEALAIGECVRGWVLFAVAYGVDLSTVKYKPGGRTPTFWSAV
jgi:hypothetical protein